MIQPAQIFERITNFQARCAIPSWCNNLTACNSHSTHLASHADDNESCLSCRTNLDVRAGEGGRPQRLLRLVHRPAPRHAEHERGLVRRRSAGGDPEPGVPASVDPLARVLEIQLNALPPRDSTCTRRQSPKTQHTHAASTQAVATGPIETKQSDVARNDRHDCNRNGNVALIG
jgi:hypothetical protein